MTLSIVRDGLTAKISEHGHFTDWSLQVGDQQLDYLISSLREVQEEIELFKTAGDIKQVESSNIGTVQYDTENSRLIIGFKNGGRYAYDNVSWQTYLRFMRAESHGKYFHEYIKGTYETKRLD